MVDDTVATARVRRITAALAVGGTLYFWGCMCAVLALRGDYAPLRIPLSDYLSGPWGLLLHSAYYVLAGSILLFAYALRAALPRARRSRWLMALLVLAALSVTLAAAAEPLRVAPGDALSSTAEGLHLIASGLAFLSASIALSLAALRIRGVASAGFVRLILTLAVLENLALLFYIFVRSAYSGGQQKLVIALIVAALLAGAFQCARRRGLASGRSGT